MKRDLALLLLAGALLLLPAAAAVDVFNPDEPREAEIAREMRGCRASALDLPILVDGQASPSRHHPCVLHRRGHARLPLRYAPPRPTRALVPDRRRGGGGRGPHQGSDRTSHPGRRDRGLSL